MAQEILNMNEATIYQLQKVIVTDRFVNCYSREFSRKNQRKLEQFLIRLKEIYKKIPYVEIDIQEFENCENEKQEAKVLMDMINLELTGKGIKGIQEHAISIPNSLYNWSEKLDKQSLVIFHCFHDIYSEKEKNILRSLRRTLTMAGSNYLGILIISNREIFKWELFPESNLDERHVVFFAF